MKVAKLREDAKIPTRKHNKDAGIDLYSCGNYIIKSLSYEIINTGITIEIPKGYFGLIKPKSRNQWLVGAGVIDENYQGEILIKLFNTLKLDKVIMSGDAVAQLVLIPTIFPKITQVSNDNIHKEKTDRGSSGGILININDVEKGDTNE